jgi:hypothetical protein
MDDIKFKIDQLRKDKIIYGVEACAISITCVLFATFAYNYLPSPWDNYAGYATVIIGVGYCLFMGIGNYMRLKKIQELESTLPQ